VRVHRLSRKDVAVLVVATAALLPVGAGSAHAGVTPNDPGFPLQWADENTGQPVPTQSIPSEELGAAAPGTPFADDSASDAWGVTTGSASIVIGEVDTGVDYLHPDLNANVWSNPGGIGQCQSLGMGGCGLDGKCKAGTRGYNILAKDCEPADEDPAYAGHGTHVAGIIGAVGGNGLGVAGMNWHTSILPVKWLDSGAAETSTEDLAQALRWLIAAKKAAGVDVRVVNDSGVFTGTGPRSELRRAIEELGEAGILFVAAAGNDAINETEKASYPCGFHLPNEICVTATNNKDELPPWANYGSPTVQLAAPGVSIDSTLRQQKGEVPNEEANYGYLSGTSMAAAQVSGAAALILSAQPSLSTTELRADILAHVDELPSLAGKVATAGRLDVCKAILGCPPTPPAAAPAAAPPAAATSALAVIRRLKISPAAFKAASSGPVISARPLHAGATVGYTDSEPAVTEFTVLAARSGVENAAGKCVAPRRGGGARGRSGRRCVRYVLAGKFRRTDTTGRNSFRFSAHMGRAWLAPGRYRLSALPTFAGLTGAAKRVDFRIIHRVA
jgi:subtilisin family serine protease